MHGTLKRGTLARKVTAKALLFLLVVLVIHVGPPAVAETIAVPGNLTIGLNSDIRSTNPGVNRDANTDTVMLHVVEGLVGYREDGSPAPLLARDIEVSADGLVYTFKLRDGVRFHNGALLTADDVVWAWRRYLEPATNWTCLSEFDGSRGPRITSITARDRDTVVFELAAPNGMLLTQMAAMQCGGSGIVHRDSTGPDGTWRWPIGTGPYQLLEWRHGQFIDLVAFSGYTPREGLPDGYVGGKMPLAGHVRWQIIRDDASRRAALEKGQVDIVPEVIASDIAALRKDASIRLGTSPGMAVSALLIQTDDPLLADTRLRQALAHSLDLDIITTLSTGGTGTPNASIVPVASRWYSATQKNGYGRDLEHAKRLVRDAGYHGQALKLLTNRRYPEMYAQALMIQSMAREAGIRIELEILEWATQLDRYQSGNYQLMVFGYTTRVDPYLGYESILGDRRVDKRKVWGNPAAIRLQRLSANITDAASRQALFDQLHELMLRDIPLIVLCNPGDVNAFSASVHGFSSWPIGRVRAWGVRRAGTAPPPEPP